MDPTSLLTKVRIAAQKTGPHDKIFFTQEGAVTLQPGEKTSSYVRRILDATSSIFHRFSVHSHELKQPLKETQAEIVDLKATTAPLEEIFGRERVKRNIALVRSNTPKVNGRDKNFSKQELAALLFCLSFITKEDLEDLLQEIQGSAQMVRGLQGESLAKLRAQFHGKTVELCSKEDISSLEAILLPFGSVQNLFWEDASHTQTDEKAPSTFAGMMERAAWSRHLLKTYPLTIDEWEYLFAKAFSPPFLPEHVVIPHPNGYLFMSHSIEEGGASKRFFAQLGATPVDPTILYRCTRGLMPTDSRQSSFESFAENLRKNLGALGSIKTYEKTKALLEHPELGFVKSPDQQIRLIGFSQGGAHAQRDCALPFLHRVKKLLTISSPGIDRATAALFREMISKRHEPLTIIHTMEAGDIIHLSGEEHLWAKENVRLSVRSFAPIRYYLENLANKKAWWEACDIAHFIPRIKGFSQAHSRLTVAAPYYRERELSDESEETIRFCKHDPSIIDPSWESVRKLGCIFPSPDFAAFARGLWNGPKQ